MLKMEVIEERKMVAVVVEVKEAQVVDDVEVRWNEWKVEMVKMELIEVELKRRWRRQSGGDSEDGSDVGRGRDSGDKDGPVGGNQGGCNRDGEMVQEVIEMVEVMG